MSLEEFSALLSEESGVLLVEFSVPSGCPRCDEMREQVDRLAGDLGEGLTVRRVDIKRYPQFLWEFGVTVCPSYVAFRDGEEVFRAAYPMSADLIASGIDDLLRESSDGQLTLVDR